jgi:hypothetical protein
VSRQADRVRRDRHKRKRKAKSFDRDDAFTMTRKEIERHARYTGAGDTDDLSRWLVAWCWFKWRPTDLEKITDKMIQTVAVSAAHRMGCRDLSEDDALIILEEARDYQRHMKADSLARWLGCTWADRCACRFKRIGACDKTPNERRALAKERKLHRQLIKRRRKGMKAREAWLADHSVAAEARKEGVSRMTIYRRRKRAEMLAAQALVGGVTGLKQAEELCLTTSFTPVTPSESVSRLEKEGAAEQELIPWSTPILISEGAGDTRPLKRAA